MSSAEDDESIGFFVEGVEETVTPARSLTVRRRQRLPDPILSMAAGKQPDRATQSTAAGRLKEFRRGWGNLPQRDRDEVLQGIDEDSLEKYRRQIESYFRALAEDQEE